MEVTLTLTLSLAVTLTLRSRAATDQRSRKGTPIYPPCLTLTLTLTVFLTLTLFLTVAQALQSARRAEHGGGRRVALLC